MFSDTHHTLVVVLIALSLAVGCGGGGSTSNPMSGPQPEFKAIDLTTGTGTSPHAGDLITVNYTGWLYDTTKPDNKGKQFDTSIGREPFTFTLGAGDVIRGWDMGFDNMSLGGRRRLIIPSELGYGAQATPDGAIPPNSALVFELQLLDVKPR